MRALPVDERRDDIAQSGEGEVDLGGFLEAIALRSRLRLTLAACQVDQVELAYTNVVLSVGTGRAALHCHYEDRVRSRRVLVHVRTTTTHTTHNKTYSIRYKKYYTQYYVLLYFYIRY